MAACHRSNASQGFDTANLLALGAGKKADPSDNDAFRAALREAGFSTARAGEFRFGNNQHPIQTIYAREVIQEGDVFTNRIIGVPRWKTMPTPIAAECQMP